MDWESLWNLFMSNEIGIVSNLNPGDDIDARCGKCKDVRTHAIIAVGDKGQVTRVRCRTCGGEHNYRNPVKATRATSTTKTTRKSAGAVVPNGPAKNYSPTVSFQIGDQITHPNFGVGLVTDVRERKIDVKFGRESKILIHAG